MTNQHHIAISDEREFDEGAKTYSERRRRHVFAPFLLRGAQQKWRYRIRIR
jgi:hypothetical protein